MAPSLSDALLEGFVGQFYRETDGVRDLLQSLRDGTGELTLPQIVVVGQESSGKSSVLESLAMLPLFPRDEHICTRMPIHLKLRRETVTASDISSDSSTTDGKDVRTIKMRLVYSDGRPPMETDKSLEQVVPLMREWMDKIVTETAGALRGIVDHVLEIHVTSPEVPTLDLIDLPGIVAGRFEDEPDDMMEQTRSLVEKYLSMPHTLVLAVVPAGERIRNSQAFQLVQQIGLTHRTIGVLTMVDRAADLSNPKGPFADVMARLDGTSRDIVQLDPHGYVAVMNRDARLSESDQLPLGQFKPRETQWLKDHLPGYVERDLASSGVLAVKVAKMLTQHVRETWVPLTLGQLDEKVGKVSNDIRALGKSSATLVDELLQSNHTARVATLKQLLGPSILRVANTVDMETMKVVQLLREKIDVRLRERDAGSFFNPTSASSVAVAMTRREEIRMLLEEHIQAIVMSALYRLSCLVRREVDAQKTLPGDAYHTTMFDNLYLLAASTMWPKAEAMLSARTRIVDRVASDVSTSQPLPEEEDTSESLPSPAPLPKNKGTEADFLESTMASVSSMLATEHGRHPPLPLEVGKAAKCAPEGDALAKADVADKSSIAPEDDALAKANVPDKPNSKGRQKKKTGMRASATEEFVGDEESRRLFFAITQHVVAPLLRELMDAGAMADASLGYLLKAPVLGEATLHWFNETTATKRQKRTETVDRLLAARKGVEGLLKLSE